MVRLIPQTYASIEKKLRAQLENYRINPSHIKIIKFAKSKNPDLEAFTYHSPERCVRVADVFLKLVDISEHEFSEAEIRHGILAALYQDAAYRGYADDVLNVAASAKYYTRPDVFQQDAIVDADVDTDTVVAMILQTAEGIIPDPASISGLIYDATLLQTIVGSPDERRRTQRLLGEEFDVIIDDESCFVKVSTQLITPAGKAYFDTLAEAFLKEPRYVL